MLITAPVMGSAWAVRLGLMQVLDPGRFLGALVVCACVSVVFIVLLLALARLFRVSEINELVLNIVNRLRGRQRSAE